MLKFETLAKKIQNKHICTSCSFECNLYTYMYLDFRSKSIYENIIFVFSSTVHP